MIGFQFTEHIDRPPLDVFAVLADPTRSVDYVEGVVRSVKVADEPLAEGSMIEETGSAHSGWGEALGRGVTG